MDAFKALDAEYARNVPPPDTFTIVQYAKHMSDQGNPMTRDQARVFIERLEREGAVELVGKFGGRQERHYRLKEQG